MAGEGELRRRFTAEPRLVVWQTAAVDRAVSGSNFCVALKSNGSQCRLVW